jgi:hypothetical protein
MPLYKMPFLFQSRKEGLSRRRFGWHEIEVFIPEASHEMFHLAASTVRYNGSASVYSADGAFWKGLHGPNEHFFNGQGILSENETTLSYLWSEGCVQQMARKLYTDRYFMGHYGFDVPAQQLKFQHVAAEDVAFYQNFISQNCVLIEGRLLLKTALPHIGVGVNSTLRELSHDVYFDQFSCEYTFSRQIEGGFSSIGVSFAYPTTEYIRLRDEIITSSTYKKAYEGRMGQLSRLLADSVFAQECEKEFKVVGETAFNIELLSALDNQNELIEMDVLNLARGIVNSMPLNRFRKQACYGHLVDLKDCLQKFASKEEPLEVLAELIGDFPKDSMSPTATRLSDIIVERWHDRKIDPTTKFGVTNHRK